MRRARSKSFLSPLKQNLADRLSNTENRFRRGLFRIMVVVAALFVLYSFFGGDYGFIRIARLDQKKQAMIKENQKLLVKLINADIERQRLENDLKHIEYIARTKHFFTRPGEVIYRLKE
jgi:cell division protein FtsB